MWQLNWHSCDGCPEMLYGLCCLYSIGAIAFYWQARLPCIRGLELFNGGPYQLIVLHFIPNWAVPGRLAVTLGAYPLLDGGCL